MPTDLDTRSLGYRLSGALFARERLGFDPDEKQALVLNSRGRGILNCSRQWGKSTTTAAKAVHRAYCWPESLVIVVSPSARQSGEFLRKAAGFVRKLGIQKRGDGDNEISLLFPNGSRIVGLPGVEATVRGFSAVSLMLIDEAARVPEDMYNAVRPMLAVSNGDLWLMSTPAGRRGFFYETWASGQAWLKVSAPATECSRIDAAFLEEERRSMGDKFFRQEYGCEFIDSSECIFDRDLILAAMRDDIEPLFPEGPPRVAGGPQFSRRR
jgi:hypothetical protein